MISKKDLTFADTQTPFILYGNENEQIKIRVLLKGETIWLPQRGMAELFDTSTDNVSLHLKNIYADDELQENATTEEFSVVQNERGRSVQRTLKFYNLDAIIALGYRVNSKRATQFRIWATQTLKEFIKKGFVLDDERLKQGEITFGQDYFQELLERIRSIRASERRIYQQITDIFAEISVDYDSKSDITQNFYAMIQNKFHYAITGQTAAEIIHSADMTESVDKFLAFNEYEVLQGKGLISKKQAEQKALEEYQHFNKTQKITSDFDVLIEKTKNLGKDAV